MKKIIVLTTLGILTLVSCKKDYTCECTNTFLTNTYTTSSEINDTKKNAEKECESGSSSGNGSSSICKLR